MQQGRILTKRSPAVSVPVVEGGAPVRAIPLPFARADITSAERSALLAVLESGWLTSGPEVQRFEDEFAAKLGGGHALAVSSGTAALHLALLALGVREGDEVILPTMTFTSSAAVVVHIGARPVLCDVRARDLTIDPRQAERLISPRTRAVIAVDMGGEPAEYEELAQVRNAHSRVAIISDAAHSLGAAYHGRPVGRIADLTAFSFYVTKPITTAEGGMLVAIDDSRLERARVFALHGLSAGAWKRYETGGSWSYDVIEAGYKYNLPDLLAALGRVQLARAEDMRARRRTIARRYSEEFGQEDTLEIAYTRDVESHSWHLYILRLNLERLACDRSHFVRALQAEGIGCSVHFIPLHRFTFFRRLLASDQTRLRVAESEYPRLVSLPIYPTMTDSDVDDVVGAVLKIARHYRR